MDKQKELEAQESHSKKRAFPNIDAALNWLKEHAAETPPGTHVVVAGVGFIIVVMGGALFLAPI